MHEIIMYHVLILCLEYPLPHRQHQVSEHLPVQQLYDRRPVSIRDRPSHQIIKHKPSYLLQMSLYFHNL